MDATEAMAVVRNPRIGTLAKYLDAAEVLADEVERLRAALRPFANRAQSIPEAWAGTMDVTLEHLRAAAAALE